MQGPDYIRIFFLSWPSNLCSTCSWACWYIFSKCIGVQPETRTKKEYGLSAVPSSFFIRVPRCTAIHLLNIQPSLASRIQCCLQGSTMRYHALLACMIPRSTMLVAAWWTRHLNLPLFFLYSRMTLHYTRALHQRGYKMYLNKPLFWEHTCPSGNSVILWAEKEVANRCFLGQHSRIFGAWSLRLET